MLFSSLGEALVYFTGIRIPGPLAGMALLLLVLLAFGNRPHPRLESTSGFMLKHLSLVFIPATVGAFYLDHSIYQQGPAILLTIVISTLLAMWLLALLAKVLVSPRD